MTPVIKNVLLAPIQGAYYYEDVAALQKHSVSESERWFVPGSSPGYRKLREVAEGISVGLVSDSGNIYWGDCIAVSYSSKAGRQGPFRTEMGLVEAKEKLLPALSGSEIVSFRESMEALAILDLAPPLSYGVSQAILNFLAGESARIPVEVLCEEWMLPMVATPVPLQGSCGNDRYDNADKMIANRLAAFPHTQVDDIPKQLGYRGEVLAQYIDWLVSRVSQWEDINYLPILHLDVHGAIGKIFDQRLDSIADYLVDLEKRAGLHPLRMESVILENSREEQIATYCRLKEILRLKGSRVQLVADEWANRKSDIIAFAQAEAVDAIHIKMPDVGSLADSLESVLACRQFHVQSLLGGSCIETEISNRSSVHVAMAVRPDHFLCKPGMGVNEAIMMARNEMNRISIYIKAKATPQ